MNAVKLARVDCENEHEKDSKHSWVVSAALIGEVECPICGDELHAVESVESHMVEAFTDSELGLGQIS